MVVDELKNWASTAWVVYVTLKWNWETLKRLVIKDALTFYLSEIQLHWCEIVFHLGGIHIYWCEFGNIGLYVT